MVKNERERFKTKKQESGFSSFDLKNRIELKKHIGTDRETKLEPSFEGGQFNSVQFSKFESKDKV